MRLPSMRCGLAVGTALLGAALLVACGGDGDDGAGGSTPPPASPASTVASDAAARAQALCAAGPVTPRANVQSPELIEVSGVAASRQQADVVWAHNDSGDAARVFALSVDGRPLGTFTLSGAQAIDWEDMALGPGPDAGIDYLYMADIGDNAAQRPEVVVYRLPEPDVDPDAAAPASGEIAQFDRLVLRYPDRPHDAETFMVDPRNGDLVIVTKDLAADRAFVMRAPGDVPAGEAVTMEQVASIEYAAVRPAPAPAGAPPLVAGAGHLPTGGEISPDGGLIALRTYGGVWIWPREDGATIGQALSAAPCAAPSEVEAQGEAVAFEADGGGYITISEGANPPINRFR